MPFSQISKAIHYAATQHRHQRRKDAEKTPYINHPIALMHILSVEAGIQDSDILVAALLHDVVEDCSGPNGECLKDRENEIRAQFGEQVLTYVLAVTDDKSLDTADRKRLQVEHGPHLPVGAKLVKLADKIANLRDMRKSPPVNWPQERVDAYFTWARKVVDGLRGTHPTLEKLFDEVSG